MKFTIKQMFESMLEKCGGNVEEVIDWMKEDAQIAGILKGSLEKLLRLAKCPSSPLGEKTNAAMAGMRIMVSHFNQ